MANNLSPEEFQEIGRRYYKQQQYQKAAEAFTETIEAAFHPTVAQYDHRAACYDKLQDFNSALKDARGMIKLDKTDVKGHLRMASILQKVNNPEKALEIYKYGMKHVHVTNKDFKLLQQLHDQLTRKLSPARSFDPFTALPLELAQMVVCHLTFKQMVNCLRVSKGWKKYLTQCPRLWTNLDLSGARKDVDRHFVRDAVKYSEYKLHSLTVDRFRHTDMLRNIATMCKQLTTIQFLSGALMSATIVEVAQCALNLKKLVLLTDVTLDTVAQILRLRPTLEHAEFSKVLTSRMDLAPSVSNWGGPFPKLHTLALQQFCDGSENPRADFGNLFQKLPALTSLTIKGWSRIGSTDMFNMPLTHGIFHDICVIDRLPKTIERLEFKARYCNIHTKADFQQLTHLTIVDAAVPPGYPLGFSSLLQQILKYSGEDELEDGVQLIDLSSARRLQHLALRNCTPGDADKQIKDILYSTPRITFEDTELQSLDLTGWPVTDDDCDFLAETRRSVKYPLHTINFSRTMVTGAGVKALVDGLPTLRTLIVDDCTRITSRDIYDYAAKKGIKISMRTSEMQRAGAGRKIRFFG